jgi:structural maintenance of chromosome 4
MQAVGCDTTREELTKRLPELRKQSTLSETDKLKLKSLLKAVDKCKSDVGTCSEEASKLEEEVTKLQKSILEAGGSKLQKQQDKCDRLASLFEKTCKMLSGEKVAATSAQKNSEKAEKLKLSYQNELQDIEQKFETLDCDIKMLEEKALVALNAFDDAKEEEEAQRNLVQNVTNDYDVQKKSFTKLMESELELVGQIDTLEKQLREADKRFKHYESEMQKLYAAEEEEAECDMSDDESIGVTGEEAKNEEQEGQVDLSRHKKFPTYSSESLKQYQKDEIKETIKVLEQERDILSKNSNMGAIAEYRKKEQEYLAR